MSLVSTCLADMSKHYMAMTFDPTKPYNDLPNLPPKAEVETARIYKALVAAHKELATLKGAGNQIPNQAMLINSIPTLEAQASSEIENIVTTADSLFQYAQAADENADPATKEAFKYRRALYVGFRLLKYDNRPVSTVLAETICSIIKGIDMSVRQTPGTTLTNRNTGEVVYTPPENEMRLRDMLGNWETYLHTPDHTDALIRMAVAHYQFEAIHPFTDGNGRTGRLLNLLFLVEEGLLDIPVLYLSRYIIQHRADYYQLLRAVTAEQKWEDWICYMLAAVTETARWTTARIEAVRRLLDETAERIKKDAPRIYSRDLAEAVFVQPYSRIADLVDAGIAKRQSASQYLKALCDIGVLEERRVGREKLFINQALLQLLTDRRDRIMP
jgi:Fic family protein